MTMRAYIPLHEWPGAVPLTILCAVGYSPGTQHLEMQLFDVCSLHYVLAA